MLVLCSAVSVVQCCAGRSGSVESAAGVFEHSLSTLMRHSYVVGPPCRCKVRDDSSSIAAQFVLVVL